MECEEGESEDYDRRRAEFVDRVFRFHERRGTPLKRLPMLGGRELNIYHLYQEVQKRGGSEKVTKVRMWGEIARTFNLPSTVTSASYAIRNHFIKLLEHFEAVENGLTIDYDVSHTSPSPSLPTLPILPSLPKPLPQFRKMSTLSFSTPSPHIITSETDQGLSRLTRSLLCGLPNELDFAFNLLLLLSHSNSLSIQKNPSLLDIILAHVAIFTNGDPGLESMYREVWNRDGILDFHAFWETAVPEWVYTAILKTPIKKSVCECVLFNRGSLFLSDEATPTEGEGEEGVEGLRVAQVATVISNLSTSDSSVEVLADHSGVLRFLTLAMSCDLPSVRIPALDCLTNLASSLRLEVPEEEEEEDVKGVWSADGVLMASLQHCVLSEDRFSVKRGVEILGRLSNSPQNLSLLLSTPPNLYDRLLLLLLLPDCELTLITLDSLYTLTQHTRQLAQKIGAVAGLIDMLVWLQSFRVENLPQGCLAQMKLFFIGDSASLTQYLADIQGRNVRVSPGGANAMPTQVGGASLGRGVVASPLATNQIRSRPVVATRTSSPLSTNQIAARSGQSSGEGGKTIPQTVGSSLYSILGSGFQTGTKSTPTEEFAIEWLKQSYEVQPSQHLVLLVDMYAQYVLYCSSKGRKTFLNNTEFVSILRQVFPHSQSREVKTVAKKVIHFITGLGRIPQSRRSTPPLSNHTPSPVTLVTSSAPQTSQNGITTKVSSSSSTVQLSSPSEPSLVYSGTKSPSVGLSFGSSPTPPPSLSVSLSPSPSSSSTRGTSPSSTPPLRISPEHDLTSSNFKSIDDDVIVCKNDVMVSRGGVGNCCVSPTDAHFGIPSTPSPISHPHILTSSRPHNVTTHTPRPVLTPSLPSPFTSTKLPTREHPVATPTSEGAKNLILGAENSNPLPNTETRSKTESETESETTLSERGSDLTPVRPIVVGRGFVGGASRNDIHDSRRSLGVKRRLGESEGVRNDGEMMDCVEVGNGVDHSASVASKTDQYQRSRSGTPILPFPGDSIPGDSIPCDSIPGDSILGDSVPDNSIPGGSIPGNSISGVSIPGDSIPGNSILCDSILGDSIPGDSIPEAKRIKIESQTNNKQQQQTTQTQGSEKPVISRPNQTLSSKPVTRQTSFTTSSIRFVNKTPTVVPEGVADSSNQSNRFSPSSTDAVRPVCLWENCMSMRYSWCDLLHHAINCHISPLPTLTPSPCHWAGCSTTPLRMKPSLVRHVQTHHCSPGPKPVPPSVAVTLAKLKHCPPHESEVESPLTKAVRVTAALVLRNLAKMAPSTHTQLRKHEYRLTEVALSEREASHAITECLAYLNLPPSHPHTLTEDTHHTP